MRPESERAIRDGHPWLYSGAVLRAEGPGDAVLAEIRTVRGECLGVGFHSPRSQIRVRLLARGAAPIGPEFFRQRLGRALELRADLVGPDTDGYRLLNAEGDGIPGWTVDRFGRVLVSQITTRGAQVFRGELHRALEHFFPDFALVVRTGSRFGDPEGLTPGTEVARGVVEGPVEFREHGLVCEADPLQGQKTGWYCDQRENRQLAARLAAGRKVLDLFAHAGGFGLAALRHGAERVTLVESSRRLLGVAERLCRRNGLEPTRLETVERDVFKDLRERRERYDIVVCDPPPLARRQADLPRATRAYKDVFRLALGRIEPGGYLFAFSCSGAVDRKLFRQVLFSAAAEAGVRAQLLRELGPGPDHPVDLAHPEGEYLKGALLRVVAAASGSELV